MQIIFKYRKWANKRFLNSVHEFFHIRAIRNIMHPLLRFKKLENEFENHLPTGVLERNDVNLGTLVYLKNTFDL